jgi:hypothetical protein
MLDQDTALALLTVADECQVRVAFLGDRHQLAAVGRGGVLDLAHQAAGAEGCHDLTVVHRFLRHSQSTGNRIDLPAPAPAPAVPDRLYAKLTAAMRTGTDPGLVFAHLYIRGQITLHPDAAAQYAAVADQAAAAYTAGVPVAVVLNTREQVSVMNAAIRGRLIVAGRVDDGRVVSTRAGDRIGVGDRVTTRRNDRGLGVANRDTWTVIHVRADGGLTVTRAGTETERVLPGGYVQQHVELGYASTAHGVQGDTVDRSLLVMGEHTGAAGAYVAMTRGRYTNTTHLVAATITDAERVWEAAFARDHADLGPSHAAQHAAQQAAQQAAGNTAQQTTPPATPTLPAVPIVQPEQPKPPVRSLAEIDRDLDPAFKELIGAEHEVSRLEWELWNARPVAARVAADQTQLAESATRCQGTARAQQGAAAQAAATSQAVAVDTEQILEKVRAAWDTQRAAAATDATLLHTAAAAADAARARDQLGWLARRHHDRTQADRTQADRIQADRTQPDRTQPDRTQPDRTQAVPGRVEVEAARTRLDQWATAWAPVIADLDTATAQPTQPAKPAPPEQPAPATETRTTSAGAPVIGASIDPVLEFAAHHPDRDGVQDALRDYAHTRALQAHPDHADRQAAAQRAEDAARAAQAAHRELERDVAARARPEDADAPRLIEQLHTQIEQAQQQATAARPPVNALLREKDAAIRRDPKLRKAEPPPRRDTWEDQQRRDRDDQHRQAEAADRQQRRSAAERHRRHQLETPSHSTPSHSTPSRGVPR